MIARNHRYLGKDVRAEVTPLGGRYRVNVFGPHHRRGLLPVITEDEADMAMEHAERLMREIYPHLCENAGCDGWAPEGARSGSAYE